MIDATERILCIASYEKGQDFMRQCAEMGVKPLLLTVEKLRDADWPRGALEEITARKVRNVPFQHILRPLSLIGFGTARDETGRKN